MLELTLGYQLIKLADASQGGDLLERIRSMRRKIASDYGFLMPQVRIRDNLHLKPNQYQVLLKGIAVGEGEIYAWINFLAHGTVGYGQTGWKGLEREETQTKEGLDFGTLDWRNLGLTTQGRQERKGNWLILFQRGLLPGLVWNSLGNLVIFFLTSLIGGRKLFPKRLIGQEKKACVSTTVSKERFPNPSFHFRELKFPKRNHLYFPWFHSGLGIWNWLALQKGLGFSPFGEPFIFPKGKVYLPKKATLT